MSNAATALRTYTWDDYRTWPDDERWEVIGGEAHAMSPSPTARHQTIQLRLSVGLHAFFRGTTCQVFPAPFDVKLSETDVVQPDVLLVCKPEQIKRAHIEGAPALVVEILSESSALRDRTAKMQLYARYGIPEVWLVTPYPSMIEVYRLDGEGYRLAGTYTRADTLKSPGFPKLKLKLKDVFDFPLEPDEKAAMTVREGPPPAYGTKRPRRGAKGRGCEHRRQSEEQEAARGKSGRRYAILGAAPDRDTWDQGVMKYMDDYGAKLEIWARERRVYAMPTLANLPRFGHKKFSSHAEMNAWKKELLSQLAETGGAKWTKP